jgi:trehalose 6-phosphate phosphatase
VKARLSKPSDLFTEQVRTHGERWTLFLDFDGTLVEIAEEPDQVEVPPTLVPLLEKLRAYFGGALAIVSGRPIESIDRFLFPLCLPCAGKHGLEYRLEPNKVIVNDTYRPEQLDDARKVLLRFAKEHPGVLFEDKGLSLGIHYRKAPEFEAESRQIIEKIVSQLNDYHLLSGKMIFEIKPKLINKGKAIETLLHHELFRYRKPIFIGDDKTDEEAFPTVAKLGGVCVKIGDSKGSADLGFANPSELHSWLRALMEPSTMSPYE